MGSVPASRGEAGLGRWGRVQGRAPRKESGGHGGVGGAEPARRKSPRRRPLGPGPGAATWTPERHREPQSSAHKKTQELVGMFRPQRQGSHDRHCDGGPECLGWPLPVHTPPALAEPRLARGPEAGGPTFPEAAPRQEAVKFTCPELAAFRPLQRKGGLHLRGSEPVSAEGVLYGLPLEANGMAVAVVAGGRVSREKASLQKPPGRPWSVHPG